MIQTCNWWFSPIATKDWPWLAVRQALGLTVAVQVYPTSYSCFILRQKTLRGSQSTSKVQVFQHCLLMGIDIFPGWHDELRLPLNWWLWKHFGVPEIKQATYLHRNPIFSWPVTICHFPPQLYFASISIRKKLRHPVQKRAALRFNQIPGFVLRNQNPEEHQTLPTSLHAVWRAE